MQLSRRAVLAGATGLALSVTAAGPAAAAPPSDDDPITLRSSHLEVEVDSSFPRVLRYRHRGTGAVLHGQPVRAESVVIDGTETTAESVRARRHGRSRVDYVLRFAGGGRISIRIRLDDMTLHVEVTEIHETTAFTVGTLDLPGLVLVSVRAGQAGASVRTAKIDLDLSRSGDAELAVDEETPTDPAVSGCAYGVLSTEDLAAAIESSSVVDEVADVKGSSWENARLWRVVGADDDGTWCGLAPGQFTYRAVGSSESDTEPLPRASVVVTTDRNGDGVVDWQDAAIALRELLPERIGGDSQHLRVVPHIPYLNSSISENAFASLLENVKRISLATDGLGQFTLVKGYQHEGHDTAHPDYAGNYNERAGGLEDLNLLARAGKRWNSQMGVHINCTEAYPEAHAFSEELVDTSQLGWNGKDQSYLIRSRDDLHRGDIRSRLEDLRREVDEGLELLYIDVYRQSGWPSDRLQRHMRDQGWIVATEWGHGFERSAVWSHWATDTKYGADTSRGINSELVRLATNHERDVFADREPLLGVPRTFDFETWQQRTDWNAFLADVWNNNLPAKLLQSRPIRRWGEDAIELEDGLAVRQDDGTRVITHDDREILRDDAYLIGWEPEDLEDPRSSTTSMPTAGRPGGSCQRSGGAEGCERSTATASRPRAGFARRACPSVTTA